MGIIVFFFFILSGLKINLMNVRVFCKFVVGECYFSFVFFFIIKVENKIKVSWIVFFFWIFLFVLYIIEFFK